LVNKDAQTYPGSGTDVFEQAIASGATAVQYDVDWIADIAVSSTDNVIFFGIEATSAAEVGQVRFANSGKPINPTLTGVVPEPGSLALLGLGAALIVARRRKTA
jgi:hypothetical protein